MQFVAGQVVRTTTAIGSDDGDTESYLVAGSLAVIHELPCDNDGMYSIAVGTTVYDVELCEIAPVDGEVRCAQEPREIRHETLWLKGVQAWLRARSETRGRIDDMFASALGLLRQALDAPCTIVSEFALAQRELFCAASLHGVGSHKAALPHFERALALIFKYIGKKSGSDIENDCTIMLEIAFREYADTLEQIGDVEQCRQVALRAATYGILWTSQWQRPHFLFQGLCSTPYWEPSEDWVQELESNTAVVFDELSSLLQRDVWRSETRPHALAYGTWQERVLFGAGGDPDLAPKTSALIRRLLPSAVDLCESGAGEVLFSALGPHTRVSPHCAPHNLRLTAHLGLLVPPPGSGRCALRVQETWREWKEGKILVFDDSFEHEVINETSQTRIVLLMRYWHPCLQSDQEKQRLAMEQFREQSESRSKFKAIPPVGSKDLHSRLSGAESCPRCKKDDQNIAIKFVWEDHPYLKAKCSCGLELTSFADVATASQIAVVCPQSEDFALRLSELD